MQSSVYVILTARKVLINVGLMSHKSLGYVYLGPYLSLKIVNNHSYKCQIDVN